MIHVRGCGRQLWLTGLALGAITGCSNQSDAVGQVGQWDNRGADSTAGRPIPVGELAACPEERLAEDACWTIVWEQLMVVPSDSGWGAVAVTKTNDIIVSGWVSGQYVDPEPSADTDDSLTLLRSFDEDKTHVWTNTYDPTPGDDSYWMAGSDANGNVFLLGRATHQETATGVVRRIYVAKVDDTGKESWTVELGEGNENHPTYGVAVDSQGNIYVTGRTSSAWPEHGIAGEGGSGILVKLDPSGGILWVHELSGANASVLSVAVDERDRVVLMAHVDGGALVRKLDEDGAPLWTTALSGGMAGVAHDMAGVTYDVAVDAWGRIAVGGQSHAMLTEHALSGGSDAFVAQLDSEGNVLWVRQFGGPYDDEIHDVKIAPGGQIYALGTSGVEEPFAEVGFLMEFDSEGTERRSIPLHLSDSPLVCYPYDMAFDSRGHLHVVGAALPQGAMNPGDFWSRDAVILELVPDAE